MQEYSFAMTTSSQGNTKDPGRPKTRPAAFLLAQLGSHAASQFARRLGELRLAPPHAGILNILDRNPGITQQALSSMLGMVPSGLVAQLDDLEARGFLERRRNQEDRRRHAVYLSEAGRAAMRQIAEVSRKHQRSLLAALSDEEQNQLGELLGRVADQQGLTHGVHPGYRRMGRANANPCQDQPTTRKKLR
jgi:DNA-binding MarR family transcriptional regulator